MIASSAGSIDIVKFLIGKGADVNSINATGQCSLHYAASKNRCEVKNANFVYLLLIKYFAVFCFKEKFAFCYKIINI